MLNVKLSKYYGRIIEKKGFKTRERISQNINFNIIANLPWSICYDVEIIKKKLTHNETYGL